MLMEGPPAFGDWRANSKPYDVRVSSIIQAVPAANTSAIQLSFSLSAHMFQSEELLRFGGSLHTCMRICLLRTCFVGAFNTHVSAIRIQDKSSRMFRGDPRAFFSFSVQPKNPSIIKRDGRYFIAYGT